MRKTLLLFMLLSVKLTFGQISDDFTDGNFSANPAWSGDVSKFSVNAAKQLQTSLNSVAQSVMLVTSNSLAFNARWEFTIQMNFDPSATNRARIYLISDQQDLNGSLNGYFVQIGESGNTDSYDLYKQTGKSITRIIDGPAKARTNVSTVTQLMPANTYWVLTANAADVKQQYTLQYPNQIIQLSSLPTYNNDKGTVILLTANLMLDRFNYHEVMHHTLLKNPDGVSLERVSFLLPANAPNNFKSAAQSVGFATPTAKNSQETAIGLVKNKLTLANKTFSPDLKINCKLIMSL